MTGPDHCNRHADLTDEELDVLLGAADADLLAYVEANTDPTTVLITLMPPAAPVPIAAFGPSQPMKSSLVTGVWAVTLLSARLHFDDLEQKLALILNEREYKKDLDFALSFAFDHAKDLLRTLLRARSLTLSLTPAVDQTRDLIKALKLTHIWAFDRDCDHIRVLGLIRVRARILVRTLTDFFIRFPLDVSGADLSHLDLTDLSSLNEVMWSDATVWPPDIAAQVHARSHEVRPGVYQVRGGNEHAEVRR